MTLDPCACDVECDVVIMCVFWHSKEFDMWEVGGDLPRTYPNNLVPPT